MQFIERQDRQKAFAAKFAKKNGYPLWNKILAVENNHSRSQNIIQSGSPDTIVLIPLVRVDSNSVNGFIKAVINDSIVLSYSLASDYPAYPGLPIPGQITRDQFSLILMKLDNLSFGYKKFSVTDQILFSTSNPDSLGSSFTKTVSFAGSTASNIINSASNNVTVTSYCEDFTIKICPTTGPAFHRGVNAFTTNPSDSDCYMDYVEVCWDIITYDWDNGGGSGGTGGSPPTGIGGGDPDPIPHNYPCPSQTPSITYQKCPPPPPGDGPGWIPIDDDTPPACDDFISLLKNDVNFANKFKSLTEASVLALNYEKGYFIANTIKNEYLEMAGQPYSPVILLNGASIPRDGFLHSHYNGLAPMFSPDDVLLMAEAFLKGKARDSNNLFIGVAHEHGPPYLLKVTNTAKFRKFAEKIVAMENNAKIKKKFSRVYSSVFNTAYTSFNERGFLNMLNFEGAGNGLTLYRAADNTCNQWIKHTPDPFSPAGVVETICN